MGACVSRQQIVKTVASPLRPPSTKSKAPTSPPKLPPDAGLTTAVDLPGKAKDDDDHPFFPHEAATPEVFSARSSTDGENSITEGDTRASAVCQTSKEPATFESSEASMQPGSFPDKFHDASDVFESSLDFPLLNSENNPLHEIGSEKERIQRPTCTSFSHRETMKEKSIEENKQEPLQNVVTLQRIRKTSLAEETNSEAAEHDHLIQHEAEKSEKVSTLLVKHSNASVESIVESNTTEQESRTVMGKETLLQMKERGFAEPELTTDNSSNEDPKIYEPSTDSGTSETPVKTGNPKLVEEAALVEEIFKETDTDPTTRKDAKTVEQTASVKEWQKGSEIAATIVAATVETLTTRDSESSLDRSASPIEIQHKELETDLAINATTKTDQTLATIDVAQAAPTEAAEKGFQSEQPSSNEEASTSLKLQITEAASSLDNEAYQETKDDSHAAIKEIEPNSQKLDIHNDQSKENREGQARDDQSKENQEGQASVVPEQAAEVKQIIHSKDLCETKRDSSQAATPKPQLEFQRPDQGKGIPEKAPPTNNSGKLDLNLNELNTDFEISKILVTGNDLNAVDQTASIENHQGEPDTAGSSPEDELDQAETLATREYVKTLKQTASIEEHQEESEPAGATSNKAAEPTQALATRTNVQNTEQPVSLEKKHQILETIPAANMAIETVEPLTSWNDAEEVETDPATNVAIETAETLVTRDNSKIADAMAPLEEQCEESEKDPTTNSTIKTIGSLAISNDARSADPTAAKEEWLDEVDVAPATNAATESAETLTTRNNAQILNPIIASQEQQKQSDTSTAAYATTMVSVLGSNAVKEHINVVDLESSNVENSKEPERRDSTDQQSVSFPALQEWHEKSDTAQASQETSATVQKLTVPSNEQHKESEIALATDATTDADIVLINTVADSLNIVGFESSNDENIEKPECKDLGQQQTVLSPLHEQHEKTDTAPAASATEEQQEESNTTPAVDGTTEPDVAPSDAEIKDAQAVELERTNAGYIEKQESTYVDQQPAISSLDLKEPEEEFDIFQTTSAAAEIAEPLATKDDAWRANQTVPSEEKHKELGTIPATTSTTEGDVVPIHWVRDTAAPRNEQHKESEMTPNTDATTGTDVVLINTVAKGVNIVGLESSNDGNIGEPESMDVDQQQTVSSPSLDEQREKSDTATATSANEEQQEESTMEPDVAPLNAISKDAQAVELERTNAGNVEKCKSTYYDQQQTVSPPALKDHEEQFDIFQTTSTAAEIDETLATKDDAQTANPVVPSEEQHEESSTIPATNSTKEADVAPIKAVTDPTVPRNEQQKEPETTPATDATTDANIVLTDTVAEGVSIVGFESSYDENVEKPESTDVDQPQTSLFPSLDEQREKSDAAPATTTIEEQQEGSNKTPAIDATTVPDVAPIDGVTKDAQAVELQSTNAENVEKQESTHIDQQQALLSPALKEPQEEFDIVQTTSAAAEIAEPFVTKDDAQIANLIVPSEEQHEESGTTPATASTTEADVVPINVVTDPTVARNKQHKESETTSAADATTDVHVVFIDTVAEGSNFVGLESGNDENVKEPESTYVDQQQTISFPYVDEQCENSDTAPATSVTEEQQTESNTTQAIDAKTELDVASTDAVTKDTRAVEHESTNAENVKKHESTYIDQQQAVSSPALKEPQEQFGVVQTTSTAAEIAEPLATKKQIANPIVPSEEQHEESGTAPATASTTEANVVPMNAVTDPTVPWNGQHNESKTTPATDATTDTDVVLINTVAEGINIVGLESSNDESTEEPGSMDVDQQQTTLSPSLDEQSDTAPATSATEEQQEESNTTPAVHATAEPDVAPFDAVTKDAEAAELESTNTENVEKRESTYIDQQQAILSPAFKELQEEFDIIQTASAAAEIAEALATKDDAWIANPTIPSEEQHEELVTTPANTSMTEADKVVELERGSAENVEETESAVVDKKQSVSFPALEEQCKESSMASATNIPTEIAEILPTGTYAQIAELIQPIEEWHEHSDTTPVTDAITEADDHPIGVEMEVVKAVELESSYAQNVEEPKSTNDHLVQIVSSPTVEKQQKDSDTIPVADAITQADDAPIHTVTEELKTAGLGSSNAEVEEELKGTDDNLDLTDLCTALEEQHEESDIPQATDAAADNVGIIPSRSDASMADPTLSTEVQHEESDTSPATDTTREADAVPANVTIEDVKFVKLKSSNIEYTGRSKSVDIEQQPKVSLLALEEQLKESDMTPATGAATEIAEMISTRDTAQMVDLIIPTEEQYEEPISNQVTNATAETNIDTVTEDAQVVELQSNNPENVEDPESADVDQKQRASSLTLEEKHEESETAEATNAAKIVAEILPTQNDVQIPDPKEPTEEQQEESSTTPTIDTTIKADDALRKDVKAVEVESGNAENAEPKSAVIEKQQTASSPVFYEQHEKTDTTPASDAMIETDVPVDPVTKDVNVVELESTNAKTEEELGNTHVDQCQKIFPPNLEELHEKSHTAPSTSATREIAKDLPTRDNVGMADPTVPTEEQHKEFETTPATDATTGIGNVVVDTVILDGQVELKSGNAENVEGPCSADIDKKQEVLGPTLEEQSEETGTDPAINAATTIANTFPTRDDQQRVDPTVSTTKQYEASTIISAPDPQTAAVVVPVNTGTEDVKMVEHENSHAENVKETENAGIDQQQAISSAALEVQHKESVTVTATHTPTKTGRTLTPTDNAQRADPTVQIEEHHEESDATQATDAPTAIAEFAKLVEPESYNPENVEQPESTDNNQQQAVSHLELEEQHEESHTSPAANAGTEIAEMLPMRNDAQIADPTVSTEELHEELNSNQVTNTMTETNIDAKPEDTQLTELQSNNSESVEATESADIEQEQLVSSLALKKKHEELETAQDTNAANEIVEILPTGNDAQRANPTEEQKESDTALTTDATTEVDGISYNAVTQDVKLVEHESSNVENAEETKCPDINQQQTILSPVLEEQHEKTGTIPSTNATMKTEIPINPIKEDVKVVELESSNAGNEKEPESTDIGQHKVISSPNSDEQHKESDTGLTTSATREFAKLLPTRSTVQMPDPTVPTEEQHKELDRTPATDATTATDNVAIGTIIQEAWVGEFKTSNAENVEGPDTADTHKKQLVSSPTLQVQGKEPGTDPAINAATEIANTLPTRDDEHIADAMVSATEQYEEPNTIPAPNATTETDLVPVNTVTEDVKIVEHESSNTENVKEPNTDQQQAVSSPTLEPQHKESVIVPATYATTKTDEALPTMGNAQKADPTVPIQNYHEESDTAPAPDAATEGDHVCINAVTQVLEVLELESGNAENIEEAESADLNQEPTVSSLALEEQHEESHTSPAADAATEIIEMLPMRNNAQTVDRRVSTDRLHEESNSNKDTNTTTEADIDAVTAGTQVVELEGDNSENVEDRVRADTDQKHSVSSPALEEKHEESEAAQTANTAKEIFEILPTRNDAQIEDPTLPTEEWQKESNTTPAVDATVKADDITYNAVTLDVKVVEIESSNADNAEHKSTHIDQQQAFSTLAFGKQHEESETTPTVDATTETHIPINPITEDIKVVELEDKANTVGEQQSTDIDQHQTVSPPALDEQHEESDTAPTTSAVTKIIKTLPARGDAQIADSTVPTEEQHQEFDRTPASDAPTEADNVAIDTVKQESKLVEVKSSNVENAEWPESADIDKKWSVLCPTLEGQEEGSQTDPATNAAAEIVKTLPARDAQQIADSKVSMTEQHEESNTIPAPDATTEAEDVPINTATEDIKVVEVEGSKAENVKETENAGIEQQQAVSSPALELQHVQSIKLPATDATTKTAETLLGVQNTEIADLTIPTEEHHGESDITLTIDATTERDAMPINAATEVQNAEVAYPTVPTEEYNGESDTTPAIDETKEEDVLAIDAVTEVIKAVELDSGNVENAEEPEIAGIKQQQTASSLALEEQHEELLMSPAANAATEIAQILPTEDYAQKAEPTVPAGPHEKTDTTPATDATTGVDVLSINEMTDDIKIVELESGNVKNNERQSKDANEQQTMFSLALEEPHDELNPPVATNADTQIVESKSINIARQQQTVSSRALEQNLEESDMALATNAATGIAKTPLPMDDTYATDTTVPAEAQYEELDTTPAIDGREVDVPPSSTVTEITKVWLVNRRDAENVEESAYTGQQQTVWSPALEDFEKSNTTPETNAAIKTAEPLLTRDNAQTPVPTEEQHEQSDATQATNATDVDVPAVSTIKEDVKVVELQSSNAGNVEEPDSTEPNQQVVLPPASEEQQEGSDTAPAINASTEIAEILHTRDNAKPVEPTIATEQLCKESDTTVSPNATIDIDADVLAVNALTKDMEFLGLKNSNVENTGDQESVGNEKQIVLSPPLDACREEKEFEQHKECEASSEVSLNEAYAIAELQHNVIKGADAEINAMGIPEITDHNIANGEKEGIAARLTKEVDHGTAKTLDSNPTKEETKAGLVHAVGDKDSMSLTVQTVI